MFPVSQEVIIAGNFGIEHGRDFYKWLTKLDLTSTINDKHLKLVIAQYIETSKDKGNTAGWSDQRLFSKTLAQEMGNEGGANMKQVIKQLIWRMASCGKKKDISGKL